MLALHTTCIIFFHLTQCNKNNITTSTAVTARQTTTQTASSKFLHRSAVSLIASWLPSCPKTAALGEGGEDGEVRSQTGGSSFVCEEEDEDVL